MKCHLPSELIMRAKNPCLLFEPPVSFLSLSLFTARLLSARCTSRGQSHFLRQFLALSAEIVYTSRKGERTLTFLYLFLEAAHA